MRFRRRRLTLLATAAAGVLALALSGCTGSSGGNSAPSDDASPVAGGTLTLGALATQALDPTVSTFSSQSRPWVMPVFSSLFWVNPDRSAKDLYQPGLASGFEYTNDDLTLTITLRDGLKFSDGTPLDADAVVWNFEQHIANHTREAQFFYNTDADHITAVDPTHVQIDFTAPNPLLLDAMAVSSTGFIVSPTAYEKLGKDAFNAQPVGAGPFMITSVDPGNEIDYAKNPNYWDSDNVYLDKLVYLNTGADASTWLTNLQTGDIQAVNMNGQTTSPAVLKSIENDPKLQLITDGPALNVVITPMNTFKAPFDDENARLAVAYCTDRDTLAKNTLQGYAAPAYVLSGTSSLAIKDWQEGQDINPIKHDVEKGTKLVKDLGGLSFTLITPETTPVVTALKQQWAECGIEANVVIDSAYLDKTKSGDYQMSFTFNVNGSLNPAGSTNYLDPTSANNKFGWRDDAIWNEIVAAKNLVEPDQIADAWHKIWAQLSENGYVIPYITAPAYAGVSKAVHGYSLAQGYPDLSQVWLEQ